ncbi:uncharacterized protein [Nicotiana tomentosiformis]|uniref:uncharacterized protein n=1 Tax=Nicotiana tomentosiformis TaxID=4098 RepID=UPI00388CB487
MSNLSKLEFVAFDISGKNYLSWVLDAEIYLAAKALENTIIQGNKTSGQDKAKAMIILRNHLDEGITSQLKLCGEIINDEELLKKTLSTFHASNMVLQQQYREKGLKKYSELISCLLVAEQHNTLLMKNHETRRTGSAPFSEVNMIAATQNSERKQNHYRGCGRGHSRGRGQGHGRGRNNYRHHGRNKQENNKDPQNNPLKCRVNSCHGCGMKGHWTHVCRTPDHFVKLYQASYKRKDNNVEAHLIFQNDDDKAGPSNKYDDAEANLVYIDYNFGGLANITHLEAGDFFEDID